MGRAPVTPVVRQPLHYFTNRRLSSMKTYIHLSGAHHYPLPANFRNDDVRYPESLVEYFIEEFTQKGDIVFDPFAGFGTTLVVAERMERVSYGMEIDQDRVNFARSRGLTMHSTSPPYVVSKWVVGQSCVAPLVALMSTTGMFTTIVDVGVNAPPATGCGISGWTGCVWSPGRAVFPE